MSERKVLNKYYPPDYDPSKIPRKKLPRNRQFSIRIMAPMNMRCNTCGEYIYKGKKFNSRQEKAEGMSYLGLHIFRFYIKCPRCLSEITFRTDPETTDYELEAGATRNFESLRTAEILAKKEAAELEEEEANNPMKVLEKRTKASQQEMEMIETLEELKELNTRHARVDHDMMIKLNKAYEEHLTRLQQEKEEEELKEVFGLTEDGSMVKRIKDDDGESSSGAKRMKSGDKPTDVLTMDKQEKKSAPKKSFGSTKSSLAGLVKRKTPSAAKSSEPSTSTDSSPASSTQSVQSSTSKDTSGEATSSLNVTNGVVPTASSAAGTKISNLNEVSSASIKVSGTSDAVTNTKNVPSSSATTKDSTANASKSSSSGVSALGMLGNYSDSSSDSD